MVFKWGKIIESAFSIATRRKSVIVTAQPTSVEFIMTAYSPKPKAEQI